MSNPHMKPDNALRQANDLQKIGKLDAALNTLHELLTVKRYQVWSPNHEKVMLLYADLSVKLRRNMKVALSSYRQICKEHTPSFEKVIKEYLKLAEIATENAAEAANKQAEASGAALASPAEIDDEKTAILNSSLLEADPAVGFSPHHQLYFVTGVGGSEDAATTAVAAGSKQKKVSKTVVPWLRYLWDTYRSVLEVLKNNIKLDHLYHEVASHALSYCVNYSRPSDFRRLCESFRSHLMVVERFQGQSHGVNLSTAESVFAYMKTRCQQLTVACKLDVWNEAMLIIQDIHRLMVRSQLAQQSIPLELTASFYKSLVNIFWTSENYLFHALAQRQLFLNYRIIYDESEGTDDEKKGAASDLESTVRKIASHVVLSSLLVPSDTESTAEERAAGWLGDQAEVAFIFGSILDFSSFPSRADLLHKLSSRFGGDGILNWASPLIVELFEELEFGTSPVALQKISSSILTQISGDEEFSQYLEPLRDEVARQLLVRLSKSYEVMKLNRFFKLVPDLSEERVERLILESDRVKIDHRSGLIRFTDPELYSSSIATRLPDLSSRIESILSSVPKPVFHDDEKKVTFEDDRKQEFEQRKAFFDVLSGGLAIEEEDLVVRLRILDARKSHREKLEKEAAERARIIELEERRKREEEEKERRAIEAERREKAKIEKEAREVELKKAKEMMDQLKKQSEAAGASGGFGSAGAEILKKIEEMTEKIDTIDRDAILKIQNEVVETEQRMKNKREKDAEKRLGHLIRAIRMEEAPLLQEHYEKQMEEDREYFESQLKKMLEEHKTAWEYSKREKERLSRIIPEKAVFYEKTMKSREDDFEERKAAQRERIMNLRRKKEELKLKAEAEERERQKKLEEEEKLKKLEEEKRKRELEQKEIERKQRDEQLAAQIAENERRLEKVRQAALEKEERDKRKLAESEKAKPVAESSSWRKPAPKEESIPTPKRPFEPKPGSKADVEKVWRREVADSPASEPEPKDGSKWKPSRLSAAKESSGVSTEKPASDSAGPSEKPVWRPGMKIPKTKTESKPEEKASDPIVRKTSGESARPLPALKTPESGAPVKKPFSRPAVSEAKSWRREKDDAPEATTPSSEDGTFKKAPSSKDSEGRKGFGEGFKKGPRDSPAAKSGEVRRFEKPERKEPSKPIKSPAAETAPESAAAPSESSEGTVDDFQTVSRGKKKGAKGK